MTKCINCGLPIDTGKFCDCACEYEYRRSTFRNNSIREIQSLAMGLAQMCAMPTTKVGSIIKGLKEYKACKFCGQLHRKAGSYCNAECEQLDLSPSSQLHA